MTSRKHSSPRKGTSQQAGRERSMRTLAPKAVSVPGAREVKGGTDKRTYTGGRFALESD
jgi:hypothetical protein